MKAGIGVLALGLFVLLAVRFAPNWFVFDREYRAAMADAPDAAHRSAVRKSFLDTVPTARGVFVVQQAADLRTEIPDPNHKIVRWRLLMPAVGYFLHLSARVLLGLAPLGCLGLVAAFVALGWKVAVDSPHPWLEAAALGLVGGATAPFFASMGWLGYYDAWLALALLGTALVRARVLVLATCVAAPWLDERFILGLPLALCVRWAWFAPARDDRNTWVRREVLPPLAIAALFAIVRLALGGSGGSQTVGDYLHGFVFGRNLTATRMLYGAWEGLRVGWVPVLCVGVAAVSALRQKDVCAYGLVAVLVASATSIVIGLFTALDLSRSMVLVLPVVPLGWRLARGFPRWRAAPIALGLAAAAWLLPAHHVVSRFVLPVENFGSGPSNLPEIYAHLAGLYASETPGPKDPVEALKWYRKGAAIGPPEQQYNLGVALERGQGVPPDDVEADRWYRAAAERGFSPAESNLGSMYVRGAGVPRDPREAAKWFKLAAQQGDVVGETDLAGLLASGDGVAKEPTEAAKLYRDAAAHNYAPAETALASLYATGTGVTHDANQAVFWYRKAAEQGFAEAQVDLGALYADGNGVTPDPAQAVQWFHRAAEHGYVPAEVDLGVMYVKGAGVPKDEIEALAWFDLAADARDANAIKFRDFLAQHLEPGKVLAAHERSKGLLK